MMSKIAAPSTLGFEWVLGNVQLGVLVLDTALQVRFANPWLLRRARLPASQVVGRELYEVFPGLRGSHFASRLQHCLNTGFPVLLSESLNPAELPLYATTGPATPEKRLKQSIQIMPMPAEVAQAAGERLVLIQVSDVTPAVARERLLKQQAERMHAMAHLDALTDIGNRRHFDLMYAREWRQALRARRPLSLVLFDVDHFKSYNDHYGHVQGDACLKAVAGVIESLAIRPLDVVCRYGGEEIAMLLPETDLYGALQQAQLALDRVRERALEHAGCERGVLTLSAGVACELPEPGQAADALLLMADRALYQAKRQGRDRVCTLQLADILQA